VPDFTHRRFVVSLALATLVGSGLALASTSADASGFRPEPRWNGNGVSARAGSFRPVERAVTGVGTRNRGEFARSELLRDQRQTSSSGVFRHEGSGAPVPPVDHGRFRPQDTDAYQGRYARQDSRFRPAEPRGDRRQSPPAVAPFSAFEAAAPNVPGDRLEPLGGYRFTGDPAW